MNAYQKDNDIFLRPKSLDEYIGQEKLKNNLKIYIGAAKHRKETLDHVLFYGPPGLGKTTLANIIANEMESKLILTSGPSIEKPCDLAGILSEIEPNNILFIDEIHRLPRSVEEVLYSAMEDFKLSIIISRDNSSKTITIDLPPFTLVGATTKIGSLSSPLRSRFGIVEKINFYKVEELAKIVQRTSSVYGLSIDKKSCIEIAKRSRGTPRIANIIFKRVRDFAHYQKLRRISYENCIKSFENIGIDELGLDSVDLKYLDTLVNRFNCGPVGLDTLSSYIGEEPENIEQVYEPYLLKLGMIDKTLKGRVATKKAIEHLKSNNY
ncbi:MAG: Holliday junction branch migration DNA helicase RuvB [Bacilli bacterium]|nr:Holliday junction branch migration DNA helicase RuvB [Bacilli bacterium]